ncbi:TRAP transporter 4TM/12TM fusion protein [Tamaricihabitans halophyticus]|uniref:TRAP transporter 4TM/12TM fusion protein n=1 Tax=Tamaricihabitans halophyticus TaxID=1262583 RepID=A0A4R2QY53_9PSEU|nr:TRAP transporter permease [Tamaricihabitans halophyticus]TCP55142.1 TRAP transporter 4TM/12TM fusion protein [Tamaricihabitans halophyticus]
MTTQPKQPPTAVQADLEQLKELDLTETGSGRDLHPGWQAVVFTVGLALSLFHLYTGFFGTLPGLQQGSLHLALGLGLLFLLYPGKPRNTARARKFGWALTGTGLLVLGWLTVNGFAEPFVVLPAFGVLVSVQAARYLPWAPFGMPAADVLLAVLAMGSGFYVFLRYEQITNTVGKLDAANIAVGTVGVLLILVAAHRALGSALVVLASAMLLYAYIGPWLPGFLEHGGYSVERIVASSFLGTEGVFGTPIAISSTFIFLFLIFAAMLQRTGMEKFFTNLALGATGWATGGTAKVAVVTSAFSGTITGSSVANTVSNGAFTIPMMRKSGYGREYSGAVEAASSTGGQIAPPVMGAAAFLMIEFTGVSYLEIIKAALIPAILFFVAQFAVVHFDAKRLGIRGLPRSVLPSLRRLLATKGYLLIPIIAIFVLLSLGYSPIYAAMRAIAITIGINLLVQLIALLVGRWRGVEDKLTVRSLVDGLVGAAKLALPIIAACAAAGLIAGVITLTGLGLKLSAGLVALGQGHLLPTLILSMLACLILGIGLPTTANYVITATLAAPAIITILQGDLAEPTVAMVLVAHFFVYYFGVMADITPPVCLAAYAAAGISGGNPIKTGVYSVRIAISGFVVPFMFVLSPELLLQEVGWAEGILAALTGAAGAIMVSIALVGYLNAKLHWALRIAAAASGIALLHGDWRSDLIGIALAALLFAQQRYLSKAAKPTGEPVPAS